VVDISDSTKKSRAGKAKKGTHPGTRRANSSGSFQQSAELMDPRAAHATAREISDAQIDAVVGALDAMVRGDFSVRLPMPRGGRFAELAAAFNAVVTRNERFTKELVRLEQVVGREGKMAERARLPDVAGAWATGIEVLNQLVADLVQPTTEVARVLTSVAQGDLTQKMALEFEGQPVRGEFLRIGTTVNTMVDQLNSFAGEVTRVAKEVGTEGKLGGQADVKGVSGVWKDLTDNVNGMARNLTDQVRNIAEVSTAVASGDLSRKITVDAKGEVLALKNTINTMVDQLNSFAAEVTRVAKEVGTEGKLGGQADVKGVSGVWKDLTDNVNFMAANLTTQVRGIVKVVTAVANGDLSQKLIGVEAKGEIAALADTLNNMTKTLGIFAEQVTNVARTVGVEGKLGAQAEVPGVAGTWKDLTDNVNLLANNLTAQVRNIASVTTAVANGDLSKKITVDVKGEILELKNTINTMVDQLNSFASEVTRVAREVGTEGKLGGQAVVKGVSGVWKDLTDNVNSMASNLTDQVRNIADVSTAVARGDLSKKITVSAKGEILELKNTINTMVDQLNSFAGEVTRVAKEVGTEGKLGGQADVRGVSGTWKDLTDNVNFMAANLTMQVRGIARVVTAVANGDLTQRLRVEAKGEIEALAGTINSMCDTLGIFAEQVTDVARTVGVEGKLGAQAMVPGVAGTWKDLTDNVNLLANNLTAQVRNIAEVTTAVANGDLSKKITVDVKGEILQLKDTINTMVDQLRSFAGEVTRVAKEVGTEGKLGGQADVKGVSGVWKDLTDNVNVLAGNLTDQVRNIALVTTAVANGDLSKKITVEARGEILALKNTINIMVDQLNSFAAEVTRVAREVGTEGKLGGQADVKNVSGVWKDLTDNVNVLAGNLTDQVRNIAKVTTAVANGDLSQKITVEARGEILQLKDTVNTMVDQLRSFAGEVTRVAKEVGTEGKLGGQAIVQGVSGVWKDLTDNVNFMARNLTDQVRNIAKVSIAIANGDLSQKIAVEAQGEILELKNTINIMVDQLRSFAGEVTRVAREVGSEGKLGGQAEVVGVSGVWKDLTDNVNFMARNLTDQVRNIALVTTAVANGDLSKKITVDVKGEILELKNTINTMVDQLNSFASEVTRVAKEVGSEGRLGGQAEVKGVSGVWKDLTDNVNHMARNLTTQVRGIVKVVTAVATGDLKQKLTVEAKGEVAALADTINNMTDTLGTFAEQVSAVAREVGVEGKLGGQARVPGVAGTWKDLTDNVNFMASNLTTQVRGIVKVVTAVANGDLTQKLIGVEAKGEIAALADTINNMTDTLGTFAEQVTSVAREVGIEGKLGGQAKVPGALGTWRQLTDNVNQLAASLTTQIRAIAEVATAVTKGDLTRSIAVEAAGEVAALKDNVNQMIVNLRETTQKNTEQDWLKTNLARFSGMMQGQKNLDAVARLIMSELTPLVGAHHGAFFMIDPDVNVPMLKLTSAYAYREHKAVANRVQFGEGLIGQCALEKKPILLTQVPNEYIAISSGLGEAPPHNIIVLPVLFEGEVKAVIELASFHPFSAIHQIFLDQLMESIGVVLNMISANMRTEELLLQSQSLTQELQTQSKELQAQQAELKRTNANLESQAQELELKARQLEEEKTKVEHKNREVEFARTSLEEKAKQLSLVSKYKSEFLANMSHELRTPLNSLLILAKLLSDNADGNLSDKQLQYARTIHGAGGDLLTLINEILDLSKVESGKMPIEVRNVPLTEVREVVLRSFEPIAGQKSLQFEVNVEKDAPNAIRTDSQRLHQVLKNLLSNAFKFTTKGTVKLTIGRSTRPARAFENPHLIGAPVVYFEVRDTGIGIAPEKQQLIFEAFQQADGSTARRYGGTGLGLSISREIAKLLGGEIQLESVFGKGSAFTLYLPDEAPRSAEDEREPTDHRVAREPIARWPAVAMVADDRAAIKKDDRVVLIIEDDQAFARVLLDIARQNGFRGIVALGGDEGLELAKEFLPAAIMLDIRLPRVDGWHLLEQLKSDPDTRHIPVHVVTVTGERRRGPASHAFAFVRKPVSRESLNAVFTNIASFLDRSVRRLLVVEDDAGQRTALLELLGRLEGVETVAVDNAAAALQKLTEKPGFDCLLLDLGLPDVDGRDLVAELKKQPEYSELPVIVYTGRELAPDEEKRLRRYVDAIVAKGDTLGPEKLVADASALLHRPDANARLERVLRADFSGRRVLVIDDDVRNVYALTSVLETLGLTVRHAESGRAALDILGNDTRFDLVLTDIMMPGMDGYETIRAIHEIPALKDIPIIAVTAKAMPEDRQKCLDAGAADYLAKPVDANKLEERLRRLLTPAGG